MECKLIETAAFDELKSIVNRLHTQATRLAVHPEWVADTGGAMSYFACHKTGVAIPSATA